MLDAIDMVKQIAELEKEVYMLKSTLKMSESHTIDCIREKNALKKQIEDIGLRAYYGESE